MMEKPSNRFYTYAYLREDRTPYYIGKGSGYRITHPTRNIPKPPTKDRIIFLKKNLNEEEAFKHEIYMIAIFGRRNNGTGILRNLTDGGEGNSGYVPTKETRNKISISNKGKIAWNKGIPRTEETKQKQSESMKGKPSHWKGKNQPKDAIKKMKLTKKLNGSAVGKNNPMAKRWKITFEDGRVEIIDCLQTWAIENGYRPTSVRNLYNGNSCKRHKDIVNVEPYIDII